MEEDGTSLLLISQTPMSDGLKASSGCEMGSLWGVFMGLKAGGILVGLGVVGAPGRLLLLDPNSFESPKGAPALGIGDCPAAPSLPDAASLNAVICRIRM